MKKLFLIIFFIILNQISISQNIDDTLRISFSIAHGEFGTTNQAILVTKNKAKFIQYKKNSYGIKLQKNIIYNFYKTNKYNYIVLNEINLNDDFEKDIEIFVSEIKNKKFTRGFSNAPEYYTIISDTLNFVLIDSIGNWNKNIEIIKKLGLLNTRLFISIDSVNISTINQLSFFITLENKTNFSFDFKPKSIVKYLKIYSQNRRIKKIKILSSKLNKVIQIPPNENYNFKVILYSKKFIKNQQYKFIIEKSNNKEKIKKNNCFLGELYVEKTIFYE